MKKLILLFAILFCLVACGKEEEPLKPVIDPVVEPTEEEQEDEDEKVIKVSDLEDNYEILTTYLKRFKEIEKFEMNETGSTNAKKGFIKYEQKTTSTTTKENNIYYLKTVSSSSLVNTSHEATFENDNVTYCDNNKEKQKTTFSQYKEIYGVTPLDTALCGYIINKETVLEITKEKQDNEYVLTVKIDGEKGGINNKIQMKKYGDLNKYPVFFNVTIQIYMNDDFIPSKIIYDAEYEIDVVFLGSMRCNQHLTDTYKYD